MMTIPPIGPRLHGAIDYGFVTMQAFAPRLFGLHGAAKYCCYAFAATQGVLNAFTDQPLALRRVVPFRVHGQVETPFVPALVILPWLTGALRQRPARHYFFSFFAVALANYLLTNYNAPAPQ